MKAAVVTAVLGIVLLSACAPAKPAAPAADQPKYDATLSMAELMGHVVDPAAFAFWRGSGTEVTETGERDLSPTTPQGWIALENGAATLVEAGNAIQLPGRSRAPIADWNRWAQAMSARAVAAKLAAEKHDKAAMFAEGGRLYETCTGCHAQFVIEPALAANPPENATLPSLNTQDVR